jgi:hypothetical protein
LLTKDAKYAEFLFLVFSLEKGENIRGQALQAKPR